MTKVLKEILEYKVKLDRKVLKVMLVKLDHKVLKVIKITKELKD